jgi:hypothetical protein
MAEPGTIDTAQLMRLSGLTDRRLRELAEEGWLPRPNRGEYSLVPTIQGLLRYYRERDAKRVVQDSYDSIASCAAAMHIPITTIKHAKRRGCSAFRGSRVYLAPLIQWIFESADNSPVNYDKERAQQVVLQNAKLKYQIRQLKYELIPAEEVRHLGAELGNAVRKVVLGLHRLAPSLLGQPIEVLEARLKEVEDDILKQFNIIGERIGRWKEPA